MSELAVKEFFRSTFETGIDSPVTLLVYRQRPKSDIIGEQAVIVVAELESDETRMTVNRPLGQKIINRTIAALVWLRNDDSQAGGDAFDFLKAECSRVIRGVDIPQDIYDPVTGELSRLMFVGERIRTRTNAPVQDENQDSSVVFTCAITFPVTEVING